MATTIPHSASVADTADAVRNALARFGHRAFAAWDLEDADGAPVVWVIPDGALTKDGEYFRPGQLLVVEDDGSYRIEGVAAGVAA